MSEKLDVLDLIINTLKEHEKTLDNLLHRLNEIVYLLRNTTMELIGNEVKTKVISPSETSQPMIERATKDNMTASFEREAERSPDTPQLMSGKTTKEKMTETRTEEAEGREGSHRGKGIKESSPVDDDRFLEACKRVAWENFLKILKEIEEERRTGSLD